MLRNLVVPALAVAILCGMQFPLVAAEPQLSHAVYFTLKDRTGHNKELLVKGCREFLSEHDGTVYFSVGVVAGELDRDVNDRDFDVSLLVVFRDKTAHDAYQTNPRHLKFIEECKELWQSVRVFDSYLASGQTQPTGERKDVRKRAD